jgi:hypothetical protein
MAPTVPVVMVSSTFYDLRQVRADLTDFISAMGYIHLLSELDSFPIDPGSDTIENCRRRVENDADILVLVIGGRYGHVDSATALSVTNLEYLAARAKRIPIFAFVQRSVLAVVPVWKASPAANFSAVVDDPRVFAFIDEVRSVHKVWTSEFDTAQNIIFTLRHRFAHLAKEGVDWSRRVGGVGIGPEALERFRGRALRLVLEKPPLWEYRLLFQVVRDELQARSTTRRDHQLGIVLGVAAHISGGWGSQRMSELNAIYRAIDTVFGGPMEDAFGPPGEPGDPEKILFIGQRIGLIYGEAIDWSLRVRRTAASEVWAPMLAEMAKLVDGYVDSIERWAVSGYELIEASADRADDAILTITLKIDRGGNLNRVMEHLQEIERQFAEA